jgi:hypothetical protein
MIRRALPPWFCPPLLADRFIVPALSSAQQHQIEHGQLLLEQLAKNFISEHLGYRLAVVLMGAKLSLSSTMSAVECCLPGAPP